MSEKTTSPQITDDDSELVAAINGGQTDRFYELVKRYESRLYNFGIRMCGNTQDAEDMIQDTFLNVFRYLGDFRYETKFKNWLYRVASSVCLKKKRKSKFAPDHELSLDDFIPGEEDPAATEVPAWARTPSEQLLSEELAGTIKEAILDLPEKYRLVVLLRDVEGFSTDEAAEVLDITPANVKVRLHRARLFLRDALKGYFSDGP